MKAPRLDEWLAALKQGSETFTSPEGFTTVELIEATGLSDRWVYLSLAAWIRQGRVRHAGFRAETTIHGRRKNVPIYQYVGGEAAAKRAGHGGRAVRGR